MVSPDRRNVAIVLMLAWLVLSPYAITTSHLGSTQAPVLRMELAAPTISGPSTFEFENGSLETIVYSASDPNPKNYSVAADGVLLFQSGWNGGEITVFLAWLYRENLIDSLPKVLTLTVTVFNDQEESSIATTTLTAIQDVTAPQVESYYVKGTTTIQTSNITYEFGSFGHEVLWNFTESNPEFYNLSRTSNEPVNNNTVLESGLWDGRDILINIDGLNMSRWYLYSLFVNDKFGRNATSLVNVTVVQDLTSPTVTSPDDISYEFGDEGFEILWHAYDSNPKNYSITAVILYNDTSYGNISEFRTFTDIVEPSWSFADPEGEDIAVSVDGLFLGNYSITLTLFDDFDRMSNDTVNVTIYEDIRAPVITASGDLSYEEGYTGYSINWTAEESNPKSYNLTLDGEVYQAGVWRGQDFLLNVDDLAVGVYIYNMTYTDFFDRSDFSLIEVEVTPDAHLPTISQVTPIQTFATATSNNVSVHAYVWDLNDIFSIEIQWGIGDPTSADFEFETHDMEETSLTGIFGAQLGEYRHGNVVWFKIVATDNSSVQLQQDTGWISLVISGQGIDRVPAVLYAVVGIFGALSLLVILVMYFRTKTR